MSIIVSLIAIQIVVFAGLAFFLRKMMTSVSVVESKRLAKITEETARKDQELVAKAEQAEALSREKVGEAEQKARAIMAQVELEANKSGDAIKDKARLQAEGIIKQAMSAKDQLRLEIETQLQPRSVSLAFRIIRMILKSERHHVLHDGIVNDILDELEKMKAGHWHFPDEMDRVQVKTPYPLTAAQQKRLLKAMSVQVGRPMKIEEVAEKDIVAGLVMRGGNVVMDGGLEGRLAEAADAVSSRAEPA